MNSEVRDSIVPDHELLIFLLVMLGAVLVALLFMWVLRRWTPVASPLRRPLSWVNYALLVVGLGLAAGVLAVLVPTRLDSPVWWVLVVALGVGLGWATRDIFPDLLAGMVLMLERRIRKGMWVSGEGFQGTVERRTLRATWLRDSQGHRLAVPNRSMVGAPIVYDAGADTEHEVVVRLQGYDKASEVRQSLQDAVLASPWVLAGSMPVVLRDPQDPVVWRVRTKLLEPRFAVQFEGELLERTEDLLRYEPPLPEPPGSEEKPKREKKPTA